LKKADIAADYFRRHRLPLGWFDRVDATRRDSRPDGAAGVVDPPPALMHHQPTRVEIFQNWR
jgi:hypothetical protein